MHGVQIILSSTSRYSHIKLVVPFFYTAKLLQVTDSESSLSLNRLLSFSIAAGRSNVIKCRTVVIVLESIKYQK